MTASVPDTEDKSDVSAKRRESICAASSLSVRSIVTVRPDVKGDSKAAVTAAFPVEEDEVFSQVLACTAFEL